MSSEVDSSGGSQCHVPLDETDFGPDVQVTIRNDSAVAVYLRAGGRFEDQSYNHRCLPSCEAVVEAPVCACDDPMPRTILKLDPGAQWQTTWQPRVYENGTLEESCAAGPSPCFETVPGFDERLVECTAVAPLPDGEHRVSFVHAQTIESCNQSQCDCEPGPEGTCEITLAEGGLFDFTDFGSVEATVSYPAQTSVELVIEAE